MRHNFRVPFRVQMRLYASLFLVFLVVTVNAQQLPLNRAQQAKYDSLRETMPDLRLHWIANRNNPGSIGRIQTNSIDQNPKSIQNYLFRHFGVFYNMKSRDELKVGKSTSVGKSGSRFIIAQQYNGIPVYGGQLNLGFDNNRRLTSISGKWLNVDRGSTRPELSKEQAVEAIRKYLSTTYAKGKRVPRSMDLTPSRNELVWYSSAIYGNKEEGSRMSLAYRVTIGADEFFVNAQNGSVLNHFSRVLDARDREVHINSCDPSPVQAYNEAGAIIGSPAADATNMYNFLGTTYDYFSATHGRDGYDDAGSTLDARIDGVPAQDLVSILLCALGVAEACCNQFNAVWNGLTNQMVFGDGGDAGDGRIFAPFANSEDVVAHELTHGVTQYSVLDASSNPVGLDYNGESGALNEAMSDIFASMVDRADWQIGEDIALAGYPSGAMRNMQDPTNGGSYDPADPTGSTNQGHQPHHTDFQYTGTSDNGGVHINSGIINHCAFLMSDGGTHTHSGVTVVGLGRDVVEQIFYRMLTLHLTPTATFLEARQAALTSVDELFPGDAAKYATVHNAFLAVGICDGSIPGDCTPFAPITGRDPAHIALALDISGSMNSSAGPGGRPKIEVLRDAVEIFLQTWEIFSVPGDEVEVVYFGSDVDPLVASLGPLPGNVSAIVTDIRSHSAGGYTAMGGGLKVCMEGVSGETHPATILFTNGIQNVNPLVLAGSGGDFEFLNGTSTEAYGGSSSVPASPGTSLASYNVPVHCIGVGATIGSAYHDLLDDIRTETGGEIHLTNEPDVALRQFYLEDLVTALNINTLEMVDHREVGIPSASPLDESFELDAGVNRLSIQLHWSGSASSTLKNFKIEAPNGTVITPTFRKQGDFYSFAVVDFPANTSSGQISAAGTWRIYTRTRVTPPDDLQLTVLVDEEDIHYTFSFPTAVWAGSPLILTADMTRGRKKRITRLDEMRVDVLHPKVSLGEVWAKSTASPKGKQSDELSGPADFKLANALRNKETRKLLVPVRETIKLNDKGQDGDKEAGDGLYSGTLKNTQTAGLYQFTFTGRGKNKQLGTFTRTKTLSTVLQLKPEAKQSTLKLLKGKEGKLRYFRVWITPRDAAGQLFGPGRAEDVLLKIKGITPGTIRVGSTRKPLKEKLRNFIVTDNLDGSYEIRVPFQKGLSKANTLLTVNGEKLYSGPFNRIGR